MDNFPKPSRKQQTFICGESLNKYFSSMMRFLQKDPRFEHQLQLVSVHIPKTAGTSFRNTLKAVYGEQQVARLDITLEKEDIRLNEQPWQGRRLPRTVQVVHGHFSPTLFYKYFRTSEASFITWLRHPVERVLSNYYYLVKRLQEELQEEKKGLNILSKLQRSLEEYAAAPINQNRMAKFLTGKPLSDFSFVGIQDHYGEDLQYLAEHLGWQHAPHFQHNVTGKKYDLSPALRTQIAAWNEEDMHLYEQALELRQKRLS